MGNNELGYVVSRSGKVLDSTGRVLQGMLPANDLSYVEPLASLKGQPESFFSLAALLVAPEQTMPATRKRKFDEFASRKPVENQRTLVWVDDISSSVDDIARVILKRRKKAFGRKSLRAKKHADIWSLENNSDRHHRLVQHLRAGITQMSILQRWQSGSRELSAKWASWLLKMLRKAKPPPQALQRFLFTVLVAILPVICCGLVCQTLSILPDSEVLRAVDILCLAVEKSWFCFSAFQWEILEERLYQCKQVRMKAGTWLERKRGARTSFPQLRAGLTGGGKQRNKKVIQSLSSSSDEYAVHNDEHMSNQLVLSEGVKSLVRRALRERQIFTFKESSMSNSQDEGTAVSLICSLSKLRLKIPARGISCTHFTCFDLEFYLEMNAELASSKRDELQTPMWRCPYCGSDTSWPQIIVDGFILRILKSLSGDVLEVLVWPDGRWSAKEPSSPHSVEDEIRHSQSDDDGASSLKKVTRSVKPRVAAHSDESADDIRENREEASENGNRDGDFSGIEASSVRKVGALKSESNFCDTEIQGAAESDHTKTNNLPLLHEINLQGLIQSTLSKDETLEADFRKQLLAGAAGEDLRGKHRNKEKGSIK